MKLEESKTRKQRQALSSKDRPVCGTISYLAECRGTAHKKEISRWTAPPDGMKTIIRKKPAV